MGARGVLDPWRRLLSLPHPRSSPGLLRLALGRPALVHIPTVSLGLPAAAHPVAGSVHLTAHLLVPLPVFRGALRCSALGRTRDLLWQ